MYKKGGNPSISGLYFLQQNGNWCLKTKSKHFKCVRIVKEFISLKKLSQLHCVDNMICMMASEVDNSTDVLFQYDLLSGNQYEFALDTIDSSDKSTVCT